MAYRDDLEAALAHADAAERELATAKEELAADHERIAELERQLADAKRKLGKVERDERDEPKRKPKPKPKEPEPVDAKAKEERLVVRIWIGVGLAVAVAVVVTIWIVASRSSTNQSVVDVVADERGARETVTQSLPDAELYELRADYVDPRGISDLGRYGGRVYLYYRSPSRAATPPPPSTGPIGAPVRDPDPPICAMSVNFNGYRRTTSTTTGRGTSCGTALPTPIRCTVVDVWNEAIRRGAPENAVASIRLRSRTRSKRDRSTWSFTISGQERNVFDLELFDDECPWRR